MRMAGWRLVSSAGRRLRGFYDLSAQPGMGGIVLEALVPDHGGRQRRHGQGQVHDVQRQRGRQPPRQSHEPRHQSRHEQQRLVVMCGEGVAARGRGRIDGRRQDDGAGRFQQAADRASQLLVPGRWRGGFSGSSY